MNSSQLILTSCKLKHISVVWVMLYLISASIVNSKFYNTVQCHSMATFNDLMYALHITRLDYWNKTGTIFPGEGQTPSNSTQKNLPQMNLSLERNLLPHWNRNKVHNGSSFNWCKYANAKMSVKSWLNLSRQKIWIDCNYVSNCARNIIKFIHNFFRSTKFRRNPKNVGRW